MYYTVERWTHVTLDPSLLGSRYNDYVREMLRSDVEGTCDAKYGMTICVIGVITMYNGRIQDGTARIVVPVQYEALVFKPNKDDVIDGVVISVSKIGFFAQCGPLRTFVGCKNIPSSFEFRGDEFVRTDPGYPIRVKTEVRVKLLGVMVKDASIVGVATINEDFLGPIEIDDQE